MTGRVVFSPMTAKQMFQDLHLARKRMLKAIRLGEKLGPKVIGLGALSASVMRGKWESLDRVRALITSGSIFTCVLLRQEAEQLSSAVGLDLKSSTVAIVGAAGLVGSLASKLLAGRVKRLILVDRRINVLMELSKELMERVKIPIETTKDVAEIRKADLIIAATNAPSAVFTAGDLRPGTLIIDDSRPTSVPLDLMDQRPDVVLIEGGVGRLPEMRCTFDFGLSQKDEVFGCLGETILLCWSKMYERQYLEGKTDLELAEQLSKLSLEMGFKQAHFQWQGQPIASERLNTVRNLRSGVTQPV
jgi:predicted amino acid dehydrogenase